MNKYLLPILLLVSQFSFAENSLWVAVSVYDGSSSNSVENYGRLDQETYKKLTTGKLEPGMFKLESVYWNNSGRIFRPSESMSNGKSRGYLDKYIYLRTDTVTRIMLIDPKVLGIES